MATYKVLQDIEAEDKLVGPLTLRQCIYGAIAACSAWLSYLCIIHNGAFLVVFLLPFFAFGVFFAFPWNKQQSTEVWALAKVRFMLKPRKRIWDQSGMKHLVEVIAPKAAQDPRRPQMTQTEVQSRLKALAATVDSRGWAVKNVPLDIYAPGGSNDRLMSGSAMPAQMIDFKESASDDMFDLQNNPIAQQFDAKIAAANTVHRQQIMASMSAPQAANPQSQAGQQYWYMNQQTTSPAAAQPYPAPSVQASAAPAVPVQPTVIAAAAPDGSGGQVFAPVVQAAEPTPEEIAFMQQLKQRQSQLQGFSSPTDNDEQTVQSLTATPVPPSAPIQTIVPPQPTPQPLQAAPAAPAINPVQPAPTAVPAPAAAAPVPPVTTPVNPAILGLANNNDLNVTTIAREAKHIADGGADEVVVSLH